METQRTFLFIILALTAMWLWLTWTEHNSPAPQSVQPAQTQPGDSTKAEVPELPPSLDQPGMVPQGVEQVEAATQKIRVVTDLLDVEIDAAGGDIRQVRLQAYPVTLEKPDDKFVLLNDTPQQFFVAQSGLISRKGDAPDHHAIYTAESNSYELGANQNELKVPLTWVSPEGIKATKTLTFLRNSYVVAVDYKIENPTTSDWPVAMYRQLQRGTYASPTESKMLYTYTGGVISSKQNVYEKVAFDKMAEWKPAESYYQGGWAAMLQHYFIAAWLAGNEESNRFYTLVGNQERYVIGMTTPEQTVAAKGTLELGSRLFIGPKNKSLMEAAAPNLRLTVDYGIFTIISQPLFWLMTKIQALIGNWGWTILILTLLIKLLFFKLSETQYRSMANMRRLQPKMAELKNRYGDDRQRMGQAIMELYKTEKVNPLAGCLPILVQIPVFISLYWVLIESVELRHSGFILWIRDLSTQDPYYVLPVLMGISMFIMQKLSPAAPDPMQQKIMMSLPFVFTVFFAFFPSGLVLYWLANNVLSIVQQWYIIRKTEQTAK